MPTSEYNHQHSVTRIMFQHPPLYSIHSIFAMFLYWNCNNKYIYCWMIFITEIYPNHSWLQIFPFKWLRNGPCTASHGFQNNFENIDFFEINHLSAMVTNTNILTPFISSQKFIYFFQLIYKWHSQHFPWLLKWFWKISKYLKLVISVLRWLISAFWFHFISLIIYFIVLKWFTNGHCNTS